MKIYPNILISLLLLMSVPAHAGFMSVRGNMTNQVFGNWLEVNSNNLFQQYLDYSNQSFSYSADSLALVEFDHSRGRLTGTDINIQLVSQEHHSTSITSYIPIPPCLTPRKGCPVIDNLVDAQIALAKTQYSSSASDFLERIRVVTSDGEYSDQELTNFDGEYLDAYPYDPLKKVTWEQRLECSNFQVTRYGTHAEVKCEDRYDAINIQNFELTDLVAGLVLIDFDVFDHIHKVISICVIRTAQGCVSEVDVTRHLFYDIGFTYEEWQEGEYEAFLQNRAGVSVPEPSAFMLMLVGGLGVLLRRRTKAI